MVIRLMTVRNFLLPKLLQQLPVGVIRWCNWLRLFLEDTSHVVQKAGCRIEQQGRGMIAILLPC